MAYFPMFVDMEKKNCLIVGGGKVALRKVKVMKDFGAIIKVVAPVVCKEIQEISQITIEERSFIEEDLKGMDMVIAATDNAEQNHEISVKCNALHIPINAVDQIEDCSFIFPSYVYSKDLVAAVSSGGKSPVMTQYIKAFLQEVMTDHLGDLTDYLGSIREEVKSKVDTEAKRKLVYQKMMHIGLEQEENPSHEQLLEAIEEVNHL
ncbi:MAG: bifunctional precorrin-2 dehydrogenase/sirohydrochlorin ferrochelatase [Bacillota bacterium]|nr:bifunctional precorrin-2 dehydrogenase/sirohydrochlorin ferrochelatase [Bacillota bacterium]